MKNLPYRDSSGFCHVVLSALGGDGANATGKMLFQIAVNELGLDGAYDARYGSEKTGTPTDVSLRLCALGTPVRESGPTQQPHVLGVFRQNLIARLRLNRGLRADATVLVNSEDPPAVVRDQLQLHSGRIICLPATAITVETGTRLNIPMLAVVARALMFPIETVRQTLEKTWPAAAERNLKAFDLALECAVDEYFAADNKYALLPVNGTSRGAVGYLTMLNGGTIEATHWLSSEMPPFPGTGSVPVFHREACTDCGACFVVCSDPGSLIWVDKKLVGINEAYCKGCLRCVDVCPDSKKGKALTAGVKQAV